MEKNSHNFYIIATPIGNYQDISERAIKILNNINFIVCEEESQYKKLFGRLNIKPLKFILCNEHNENEAIELTIDLLKKGETGALISDCGTPLFEDPGFYLINNIRSSGFKITSIPGANSLAVALSLSPFKIKTFYFAGFIPIKQEVRENALIKLLQRKETIVFMESPYRLKNIIDLLKKYCSKRRIFLPFNLTLDTEETIYGTPKEVEKILNMKNIEKGEYLIVIEGIN